MYYLTFAFDISWLISHIEYTGFRFSDDELSEFLTFQYLGYGKLIDGPMSEIRDENYDYDILDVRLRKAEIADYDIMHHEVFERFGRVLFNQITMMNNILANHPGMLTLSSIDVNHGIATILVKVVR